MIIFYLILNIKCVNLIIIMAVERQNSRAENLHIEKFKLKDESEIIFIKGYGKSYGVGVDKFKNIYIPSFDRGFLYKILPLYQQFHSQLRYLFQFFQRKFQLYQHLKITTNLLVS